MAFDEVMVQMVVEDAVRKIHVNFDTKVSNSRRLKQPADKRLGVSAPLTGTIDGRICQTWPYVMIVNPIICSGELCPLTCLPVRGVFLCVKKARGSPGPLERVRICNHLWSSGRSAYLQKLDCGRSRGGTASTSTTARATPHVQLTCMYSRLQRPWVSS